MKTVSIDNKGVTLLELTISILISSILISMLLSLLAMALNTKANVDVQNRMLSESSIIVETIRENIIRMEPQKITIEETTNSTIITIYHTTDIEYVGGEWAEKELVGNEVTKHEIEFVKVSGDDTESGAIYYNVYTDIANDVKTRTRLSSDNIFIDPSSSMIDLIGIEPESCGTGTQCNSGIIKLNFFMRIRMDNGSLLTGREIISSIIV